MRIALGIEYLGTNYHGWQRQDGLSTVQSNVEQALSKVANSPITVVCAGRTDVGVHALSQVIHFDTEINRKLKSWVLGGNTYLPPDIRIQWAHDFSDNPEFHARFSATSRHYQYLIYNHSVQSAILHNRALFYPAKLDADLMHAAAECLIGEQDFSSFRGAGCQSKTAMRNVTAITVKRDGHLIIIDIHANAFLLHMVRNIIGVLLEVGTEKRAPTWVKEVLFGRDRNLAGVTAPACGLYLVNVKYS